MLLKYSFNFFEFLIKNFDKRNSPKVLRIKFLDFKKDSKILNDYDHFLLKFVFFFENCREGL